MSREDYRHKHPKNEGYINLSAVLNNLSKFTCKVIGHKISEVEKIIFEIKNSPVNVARIGYSTITCPRCGKVFDPTPDNKKGE